MRMLGYPRLISVNGIAYVLAPFQLNCNTVLTTIEIKVENFRTPNFALVADILYWLVYRSVPQFCILYVIANMYTL